jgi:hypothetical protein
MEHRPYQANDRCPDNFAIESPFRNEPFPRFLVPPFKTIPASRANVAIDRNTTHFSPPSTMLTTAKQIALVIELRFFNVATNKTLWDASNLAAFRFPHCIMSMSRSQSMSDFMKDRVTHVHLFVEQCQRF